MEAGDPDQPPTKKSRQATLFELGKGFTLNGAATPPPPRPLPSFACAFCSKAAKAANAVAIHEQWCSKNPINAAAEREEASEASKLSSLFVDLGPLCPFSLLPSSLSGGEEEEEDKEKDDAAMDLEDEGEPAKKVKQVLPPL